MGFLSHREINDAFDAGKYRVNSWRKVPSQTTASGIWFDLSMSPGSPVPNYYAATPLTSKRLAQSSDGGLFHAGMSNPVTVTFASSDATGILMTTPADYPTFTKFRLSTTSALPTGLAIDTDYYTIRVSATTSRIAKTLLQAQQNVFIPYDPLLGSLGTGTQKLLELTTSTEHLYRLTAISLTTTAVPLPMILCDYLLYYPFIDMSSTDPQTMIVGETQTRYTDGVGVQMMAVEVASQLGGVQFNVGYTNSDGVAGRVTPNVTCNTQVSIGTIITTAPATAGTAGPFLPLQAGDKGVRSVQSVTFLTGDVGLITLVLVKPLASLNIYDITGPAEKEYLTATPGSLPEIQNDAYLNFIVHPAGTLSAAPLFGTIETVFT